MTRKETREERRRRESYEALERHAMSEPLPDVEALLQGLSERLDACSGDENVIWEIDDLRDHITGVRVTIWQRLQRLEEMCAKVQTKVNKGLAANPPTEIMPVVKQLAPKTEVAE